MARLHWFFLTLPLAVLTACGGASSSGSGDNSGSNGGGGNGLPTDSVSGTVKFKGVPLAGTTVTNFLTNNNFVYQLATTNSNGNYSFTGLETGWDVPGEYQIYVNKSGYGFYPSVGSGAKVMRADYSGQFTGSGMLPSALVFAVIDFTALSDVSLSDANFAAYDGTNPPVTLPATGQHVSYAAGDDAALDQGVAWSAATRFTDNADGTIADTLTGLIWLKNAGCLGSALWADALTAANQLASGACGLTDGSTAGQWRMPNLNELESLTDVSAANPALSAANPFVNVSGGIYWTSTSYYGGEAGSPDAWTIRLSDGSYVNDSIHNVKLSANNVVWAVKGTSSGGAVKLVATGFYVPYAAGDDGNVQAGVGLISPRFIDNKDGTTTDTMTGLHWLKQANCLSGAWADALAAVNSLASGQCGLTDGSQAGQWRMPNRNELQSIADRAQGNQAQYFDYTYLNKDGSVYQAPIFPNFIESQYYWTSSTDATDTTQAWTVFSCDFGVYNVPKTNVGYTLAVR